MTELWVMKDASYGIIPLSKANGRWEALLVQLHEGHWGFPKGHADLGETPLQAAQRELQEETGLKVQRLLSETPLVESYFFTRNHKTIFKTVSYFFAEVFGKLHTQPEEIKAAKWVPIERVDNELTFPLSVSAGSQAAKLLKK